MRTLFTRTAALLTAVLFLLHLPLLSMAVEPVRAEVAAHSHAAGEAHPDHVHEHHCMPSCQTVAAAVVAPHLAQAQIRLAPAPLAPPAAGAPEGAVSSPDPPPPRVILSL